MESHRKDYLKSKGFVTTTSRVRITSSAPKNLGTYMVPFFYYKNQRPAGGQTDCGFFRCIIHFPYEFFE